MILSASILLTGATAMAQIMVPQTTVIRTPYGNVNHTTYTYQHMSYYGSTAPISNKYDFTIVLKDNSKLQTRARIEYKDSMKARYRN